MSSHKERKSRHSDKPSAYGETRKLEETDKPRKKKHTEGEDRKESSKSRKHRSGGDVLVDAKSAHSEHRVKKSAKHDNEEKSDNKDDSRKSKKDKLNSDSTQTQKEVKEKSKKHHSEESKHRKTDDEYQGSRHRKDKENEKLVKEGKDKHKEERRHSKNGKEHRKRKEKETVESSFIKDNSVVPKQLKHKDAEKLKYKESKRKGSNEDSIQLSKNEENNDNYEDDFEDYDEDFEDFDEPQSESKSESRSTEEKQSNQDEKEFVTNELTHKLQIKNNEYTNLTQSNQNSAVNEQQEKKRIIPNSFINFQFARKKYSNDAISNNMLNRAYDLFKLIEFERVDFDIFEMCPITEHSQYMRMMGGSSAQHVGSQTGDDNIGREMQTEEIEYRTMWNQNPAADDEGCVGTAEEMQKSSKKNKSAKKILKCMEKSNYDFDEAAVLDLAQKVNDLLMEEENLNGSASKLDSETNPEIQVPPFSKGCNVYTVGDKWSPIKCFFSQDGSGDFFGALFQKRQQKGPDSHTPDKQKVVVWKLSGGSNSKEPLAVLECPESVSSFTFNPQCNLSNIQLLCALNTGVVALYDLSEITIVDSHRNLQQTSHYPAYITATAAVTSSPVDFHQYPIVLIQCSVPSMNETSSISSFYRTLTLDSMGCLSTWIVHLVQRKATPFAIESGSVTDLLLKPGSKISVSLLSTIQLMSPTDSAILTCSVLDPKSDCIYVGSNSGHVIQYSKNGSRSTTASGRPRPSQSRILGNLESFTMGTVTCLDIYPFDDDFVLAGYDDGILRIFQPNRTQCIVQMSRHNDCIGVPIIQCRWSRSRPSLVISLASDSHLCVWSVLSNVKKDSVGPQLIIDYKIHSACCIAFDLSPDPQWTLQLAQLTTNQNPGILLCNLTGQLEMHELSETLCKPQLDEAFQTTNQLIEAV